MGCVACALTLALLAGCGQKGALYLPDRTGSVISRPGEVYPPRNPAPQPASQSSPAATPAPAARPAPPAPAPAPSRPDDAKQSDDSQPH